MGFLKSWLAGGLNFKVVNHILEAVQQCKQQSKSEQPVRVFVTGGLPVQHDVCVCVCVSGGWGVRVGTVDGLYSEWTQYTWPAESTAYHSACCCSSLHPRHKLIMHSGCSKGRSGYNGLRCCADGQAMAMSDLHAAIGAGKQPSTSQGCKAQ